ncbi:hypothetical protein [Maricaulis sp. CAU 1757]
MHSFQLACRGKALAVLVLAGTVVTGCATTTVGPGVAPMRMAGFDHPRARSEQAPGSGYGYAMTGAGEWSARLVYETTPGIPEARLDFVRDGVSGTADMVIGRPYLEDGLRRFSGSTAAGEAVELEMQAGPCPGADGAPMQYFVSLDIGGRRLEGCARVNARVDHWSNYLVSYLPAIDTCLNEMNGRADHVTAAYTLSGGETGVRVVDHDLLTWECTTREDGAAMNSLRALDAADAAYGEGDPIFVRGRYPQFGEGCYVYETVRDAEGVLIGSFGYDACNVAPVATAEPVTG